MFTTLVWKNYGEKIMCWAVFFPTYQKEVAVFI